MFTNDIEKYVTENFNERVRDDVVEVIFKSSKLDDVLASAEGKAITDGVIETIHNNIRKMLQIMMEDGLKDNIDKIVTLGLEVNYLYKIVYNWAGVLNEGRKHITEIHKGSV